MGLSTEWRKRERWRPLGFASAENFRVGFVDTYFSVLDPNRLIAQGWKWQRGDFSRHTDGDLAAALGRVTAKMFVMPIDEAIFFPRETAPRSSLASPKQRAAGRRERQRALGPLRL